MTVLYQYYYLILDSVRNDDECIIDLKMSVQYTI